jgi:hypothetical protein
MTKELPGEAVILQEPYERDVPLARNCVSLKTTCLER